MGHHRIYHNGWVAIIYYANQPISYDLCTSVPISHLLTVGCDCEIFVYAFVCSSSGGGVINGEKMVSSAGGWKWLEVARCHSRMISADSWWCSGHTRYLDSAAELVNKSYDVSTQDGSHRAGLGTTLAVMSSCSHFTMMMINLSWEAQGWLWPLFVNIQGTPKGFEEFSNRSWWSPGALSSIDARSDHNHLPRQLSTAFPCHRCDKCGKVFTQPGNRTRDLLQSRQVL